MTQEDIIALAHQASKEWAKEFPTPEETANPVPKRYLEIFAKLVERRKCQELAHKIELLPFGDTASSFAAWVRSEA